MINAQVAYGSAALARPEAAALRALAAGTADARQQKLALNAIGVKLCLAETGTHVPGGPEGDRASCFAEGRRFVAAEIRRALTAPIESFPEVEHD